MGRMIGDDRPITQPLVPRIIVGFSNTLLQSEPALKSSLR